MFDVKRTNRGETVSRIAAFAFAHIAYWLISASASAADWNQWRGPNRDGVAPDGPALRTSLPSDGLKPLWVSKAEIPSARDGGWASPVIADGRVYIFAHRRIKLGEGELPKKKYPYLAPDKRVGMTAAEYEEYERNRREEDYQRGKAFKFDEVVYCIDVESGETIWKSERASGYTRWPQSGSPAVVDGRIYILGAARTARCLDAKTGKDLWASKLPGEFKDEYLQSSIAVADGVAIVLCGWLFGLDAKSGKIIWESESKSKKQMHTSPVFWQSDAGPLVIANVDGGNTVCVEPRTGRERWRVNTQAGHSTPVVVGNRLLTYGSSRKTGLRCFAITPDSADELWVYQKSADSGSSPVVVDGHVYVQGERRLACVSLESGKAEWMTTLDLAKPRYASLAAADGKVFYAWEGLLCFAATPKDFQPLLNAKFDGSHLMADEEAFRRILKIDEIESGTDGLAKAERVWQKAIGNHGPLRCTSPAIADGRIFLRMKNGIACYDLRKSK
jgi:outer membrane protein assembly factor BamB